MKKVNRYIIVIVVWLVLISVCASATDAQHFVKTIHAKKELKYCDRQIVRTLKELRGD